MNEKLKEACTILGVSENATKEQIEHRYGLLLKKARSRSKAAEPESNLDSQVTVEEINEAYQVLMGLTKYEDPSAMKPTGKYEHFFYYYKWHVLIGIILVICAIFGVKSYMDRQAEKAAEAAKPPIDVNVMLFGDYFLEKPEQISDAILQAFPDWKRVQTQLTIVPREPKDPYDMALQQKSVISMMNDKFDVYIMDRPSMEAYVRQDGFIAIEQLTSSLPSDLTEGKVYKTKTDKVAEEHVYGVDITSSSLFKTIPIRGNEKYALIRFDTKNKEKSLELIEWLIRSTKP
ncbi:hypothetical protein NV379_08795 [Paenibacillus sp. N1-5-1-14]|uniref:hypothetical protein n=1 Tax=Paenibacillus radicibacter TaxID=2972488 RepID=UPI0021593DF5|nr:hypothetical protein [Paenibacillus radicibacter]MCR8642759.1 hypothetical protein [Paenibacillus radicibacter]